MTVNVLPCCIMVLLASCLCGHTLAIQIEIRPEAVDTVIDDAVQISCLQEYQVTESKEIILLAIEKDGNPIVVLRQNSHLSFTNRNDTRLKAVGHIDNGVSQSSLNLTLMTPHSEDLGIYTCVVDYLNEANFLKIERDSKNLTEQKFDIESLETSLAFLKQEISTHEDSSMNQIDSLKKQVRELQETNRNQSELIQRLTDKESPSIAFSVQKNTLRVQIADLQGKTLILPDIIMMQGTGYNVATGVFTAPIPGLYVFHLVAMIYSGTDFLELNLMAKGSVVAGVGGIDRTNDYPQSSISSVVHLNIGETVYVVMERGGRTLAGDQFTVFSGYLLRAG